MFNPDKNYYEVTYIVKGSVAVQAESEADARDKVETASVYTLTEFADETIVTGVEKQ